MSTTCGRLANSSRALITEVSGPQLHMSRPKPNLDSDANTEYTLRYPLSRDFSHRAQQLYSLSNDCALTDLCRNIGSLLDM